MNTRPVRDAAEPFRGAREGVPVEKRLADLEDAAALNRVMVAYTGYCDPYDAEGFASLFAEDGVWTSAHYGTHSGREAVRAFIAGIDQEIIWACHHITNADIEVAEDNQSARGLWYLLVMEDVRNQDGSVEGYLAMADYNMTFVKVDGRWLIEHCNPTTKAEKVLHGGWKQHG